MIMRDDRTRGDALKRKIAAHSDTLLSLDRLLSSVLENYEKGNRSALKLECSFILSECAAQTAELEAIHEEIAGQPEMTLTDLLLGQQLALYEQYAQVTRGLVETLLSNQNAERSAKRQRQQAQARLLELRLRRKDGAP